MSNTDEMVIAQAIINILNRHEAPVSRKIEAINEVVSGKWDDPTSNGKIENWEIRRIAKTILASFPEEDDEVKNKALHLVVNELVAQSAETGGMDT